VSANQRVASAREDLTAARQDVGAVARPVLELLAATMRNHLRQVLDVFYEEDNDCTEPYCTTCSLWAGMFHGMDGWRHFRGDPAPAASGSCTTPGMRRSSPGRCPPAWASPRHRVATVLDALDVAAEYKRDRAATCADCEASPAELCGTCDWRLARADE
jgi:hypothetical protein